MPIRPRVAILILLLAAVIALPACTTPKSATGPCDVILRFENVRRDAGDLGQDEWTDIARIIRRYTKEPIPPPKTSNFKALPRGEVRTCEVTVTVSTVSDLDRIEGDLQTLAAQHSTERRLDFNLERAAMLYRSNFVAAGLEVTLRGVTSPGFRVAVYTSPDGEATGTTAGRGGAWSIKLPAVPESRYVYGYAQDTAGHSRTRCFRINVTTMQQESVTKADFIDAVGIDPDRAPPPAERLSDSASGRSAKSASKPSAKAKDDW